MKVMTILGTRPEIIKLSRVIPELDKHFEHILVHTGQNFDPKLSDIFFEEMGIRQPDEYLDANMGGTISTVAEIVVKADDALVKHKPDAVLVLGDTDSALSVYAAKRRHIPIFHMEAGNRCFDQRVPEEINRKIVDHLSDINMPYTEHARRNLLTEGLPADRIIKTGSPMKEVLYHYAAKIQASKILENNGLEKRNYFVVSLHRPENVDDPKRLSELLDVICQLAMRFKVVFSVHPRTKAKLGNWGGRERVIVSEPFGFFDYAALQYDSLCVISDSGTLAEEAALLKFPAVQVRHATERPEAIDEGNMIMADVDTIAAAVRMTTEQTRYTEQPFFVPLDYQTEQVSKKVVRIILGYTRNVWRQY